MALRVDTGAGPGEVARSQLGEKTMVQAALMSRQSLQEAIGKLPRISLAALPTPLEECPRLTHALGGPRILIKRDDNSGLAFGGNKSRHLEFRIADARAKGCDVFINSNVWVSNNARIVAAACAKVGMRYIFVVRDGKGKPFQGNLLLDKILGAELHMLNMGLDDREAVNEYCRDLAERLKKGGHRPYLGSEEPFARISGTIGYLDCTTELEGQLKERGIDRTHVYLVAGTSMTGLALGAKLLGLPWKVTGVYAGDRPNIEEAIKLYADNAKEVLGLPASLDPSEVDIYTDYVAPAYAVPNEKGVEAIKLVARTEGVLLDPTYTGKAFAAVVDDIRDGKLTADDTVVFVHTGGLPALFMQEYVEALTA